MAKPITILNAYAYRSGSRSQHANIDGVIDGHLFTFTQTLTNGQVQLNLSQRVYRRGCPFDRRVPSTGKYAARATAILLAFKALPLYAVEQARAA